MNGLQTLDFKILDWIQEVFRCDFLDTVMPYITSLGNGGIFWILVAVLLLTTKRYRRTGFMVALSLLLGAIVGNLTLKPLVGRIRPFDVDTTIELLIKAPTDASFPSGHTLASFETATVLMVRERRLGIPSSVLAFLIAFSRLYLYVHYPSDVLFGMILGTAIGLLAVKIIDLWLDGKTPRNRRKRRKKE